MLLDTCGLIWLTQGGGKLTPETLGRIGREATVYVSAISAFEIGTKYESGDLELPFPPARWYLEALEHHDVTEVSINGDLAAAATALPRHHRDPADHFIIALALKRGWPVVTHDEKFLAYGVEILR